MKWISVKDSLPEPGQYVIACNVEGSVSPLQYAEVYIEGLCFHDYTNELTEGEPLTNITHWMPLPQPPKEE